MHSFGREVVYPCFTTSSIQPCTVSGVKLSIPALQHHPSSPAQFRAWGCLYDTVEVNGSGTDAQKWGLLKFLTPCRTRPMVNPALHGRAWNCLSLLYNIIHPALHSFGREVVYPCFTTSSIQPCTVSGVKLSIPALQHHPSNPAQFRAWGCLSLLYNIIHPALHSFGREVVYPCFTTSSIQPCTVFGVRLSPALQHHLSNPAQFRAWSCLSLLYNIIHPTLDSFRAWSCLSLLYNIINPALHGFGREVVYPCFTIDIEYNKRLDHRRPCLEDDLTAGSNNIVQSNKSVWRCSCSAILRPSDQLKSCVSDICFDS